MCSEPPFVGGLGAFSFCFASFCFHGHSEVKYRQELSFQGEDSDGRDMQRS